MMLQGKESNASGILLAPMSSFYMRRLVNLFSLLLSLNVRRMQKIRRCAATVAKLQPVW